MYHRSLQRILIVYEVVLDRASDMEAFHLRTHSDSFFCSKGCGARNRSIDRPHTLSVFYPPSSSCLLKELCILFCLGRMKRPRTIGLKWFICAGEENDLTIVVAILCYHYSLSEDVLGLS